MKKLFFSTSSFQLRTIGSWLPMKIPTQNNDYYEASGIFHIGIYHSVKHVPLCSIPAKIFVYIKY